MPILFMLCCVLIGYLFGSIPVGYLYAKIKGVDIFTVGSKSPGSTNIGRVFGKSAGRLVFILDFLKTFLAILLVHTLFYYGFLDKLNIINYNTMGLNINDKEMILNTIVPIIVYYTGLGAILGHNYPFTTHFKGGKGITCTCATIFYISPIEAIILYLIHYIVKKITKYVSVASIVAVGLVFIISVTFGQLNIYPYNFNKSYYVYPATFLMFVLAVWTHRENIKRLINGEENKIV